MAMPLTFTAVPAKACCNVCCLNSPLVCRLNGYEIVLLPSPPLSFFPLSFSLSLSLPCLLSFCHPSAFIFPCLQLKKQSLELIGDTLARFLPFIIAAIFWLKLPPAMAEKHPMTYAVADQQAHLHLHLYKAFLNSGVM